MGKPNPIAAGAYWICSGAKSVAARGAQLFDVSASFAVKAVGSVRRLLNVAS